MKDYVLIKGRVLKKEIKSYNNPLKSPHYIIFLSANNKEYEITINVNSKIKPNNLRYYFTNYSSHPILTRTINLEEGVYENLKSGINGLTIDYLRSGIFNVQDMNIIEDETKNEALFLEQVISERISMAINNPMLKVCVWGKSFGDPIRGVHNLHMNQGNTNEKYLDENGVWGDGALVIINEVDQKVVFACFLAFQTQCLKTNNLGFCDLNHRHIA